MPDAAALHVPDRQALLGLLRRWEELRQGQPGITEPERRDELWRAAPRPYPGLRSFSREEEDVFFARDEQASDLLARLDHSRVVVVLGGSGSGKSSLVRAGLIPRLSSEAGVPGRPGRWYVVDFRPEEEPNGALLRGLREGLVAPALGLARDRAGNAPPRGREAVQAALGLSAELPPEELLAEAHAVLQSRLFPGAASTGLAAAQLDLKGLFAFTETGLDVFDRVLSGGLRVGKPNLLLFLDQFEEAFRPGLERSAVRNLCRLLHAVSDSQPPGLFLAVTMRSEEEHRATEAGLASIMTRSAYHLGPLDDEADRDEVVIGPARAVLDEWVPGWRDCIPPEHHRTAPFDSTLIDLLTQESRRVLEGSIHRSDHLPLLQHTMLRTWDTALERWRRDASSPGGRVDLLIGPGDLERACGTDSGFLDRCLNRHADLALKDACRAAERELGGAAAERVRRLQTTALCTLARRDDRNNWARRFTSAPRIARLAGDGSDPGETDQAAATAFLETLKAHGFLNKSLPEAADRGGADPKAPLFDVSHEALIRRWVHLRDHVLPKAEQLADALSEVARNLAIAEAELTPAPESGHAAQPRKEPPGDRVRAWLRRAAAQTAEAMRASLDNLHSLGDGLAAAWAGPVPCTSAPGRFLGRISAMLACFGNWLTEAPERRATAIVPDRVRDTLCKVLGPAPAFPAPLGAALLADAREHELAGADGYRPLPTPEERRRREERMLAQIRRMEEPWRTAVRYARRSMDRPMKLLLLLVSLIAVLGWLLQDQRWRRDFAEREADFEINAARVVALAARVWDELNQGLALDVAAFELQAAHHRLAYLQDKLQERRQDRAVLAGAARKREEAVRKLAERSGGRTADKAQLERQAQRIAIGDQQFDAAALALDQWTRKLLGSPVVRLPAGPPPDAAAQVREPACARSDGDGAERPALLRSVAGWQLGLRWDTGEQRWAPAAARRDAAVTAQGVSMAGDMAERLPESGLVCVSADASLVMVWQDTRNPDAPLLPQFWALWWYCEASTAGECQRWGVQAPYLTNLIVADSILFDPRRPNAKHFSRFGEARSAAMRGGPGEPGVYMLRERPDSPRAGFELVVGGEDGRLLLDVGHGFAVPEVVAPPSAQGIIAACPEWEQYPGGCKVGDWTARWTYRSLDGSGSEQDHCQTVCSLSLSVFTTRKDDPAELGNHLATVLMVSGGVTAFAVDGPKLLVGDRHGIWRSVLVGRAALRQQLEALRPTRGEMGEAGRKRQTPACEAYSCADWHPTAGTDTMADAPGRTDAAGGGSRGR